MTKTPEQLTEAWRQLREYLNGGATTKSDMQYTVLPCIDLSWGDSAFQLAPDVMLLVHPYNYSYSKFTYLNHLQVHLKLGCFINKRKDSSWSTLSWRNPDLSWSPRFARFVSPMYSCHKCHQPASPRGGGRSVLDEMLELTTSERVDSWQLETREEFWTSQSKIWMGAFDPENPPQQIKKVLAAKTHKFPFDMALCGRTTECPGFKQKISQVVKTLPPRGLKNLLSMTDAANRIIKHGQNRLQ